jgi:hypothetical protein
MCDRSLICPAKSLMHIMEIARRYIPSLRTYHSQFGNSKVINFQCQFEFTSPLFEWYMIGQSFVPSQISMIKFSIFHHSLNFFFNTKRNGRTETVGMSKAKIAISRKQETGLPRPFRFRSKFNSKIPVIPENTGKFVEGHVHTPSICRCKILRRYVHLIDYQIEWCVSKLREYVVTYSEIIQTTNHSRCAVPLVSIR